MPDQQSMQAVMMAQGLDVVANLPKQAKKQSVNYAEAYPLKHLRAYPQPGTIPLAAHFILPAHIRHPIYPHSCPRIDGTAFVPLRPVIIFRSKIPSARPRRRR